MILGYLILPYLIEYIDVAASKISVRELVVNHLGAWKVYSALTVAGGRSPIVL